MGRKHRFTGRIYCLDLHCRIGARAFALDPGIGEMGA